MFSASLQSSIILLATGTLATAQGLVKLPENYACFDFEVSGSVFEPGPEPEPPTVPVSLTFSIALGAMLALVGGWSLRRQ